MDFLSLPPEINSARMYTGAGATPLTSAAAAWETLSQELSETAASITSTVTALAAVWIGPSASAMTASAMTYTSWLTSSAAAAAETAMQAEAAASAYEQAFLSTVPPVVIAANRGTLALLLSSNFLGVNTPAIMALEALYAEMWAQDVAAMTAYSAESAAATTALPALTPPPQVTNPLLQFIQTLIPGFTPGQPLQNLASLLTAPLSTSFLSSGPFQAPTEILALFTVLWGLNSPSSPLAQAITNRIGGATIELPSLTTPLTTPVTTPTAAAIKAGIGDGEKLGGRLSVPPNWAKQRDIYVTPERPIATPLAPSESPGLAGLAGMGGLGGLAGMRGAPKTQRHTPTYGSRLTVMPNHPFGG